MKKRAHLPAGAAGLGLALAAGLATLAAGAEKVEEQPPEGMVEHREWCDQAGTRAERLRRLEGFWTAILPECDGGAVSYNGRIGEYGDGAHGNYVSGAAFDLAEAYVNTGDKARALVMLHYLRWSGPVMSRQSIGTPFYDGRAILQPGHPLSLTLLDVIEGFDVPESVWWDEERHRALVSNISSKPDEYWSDDGRGFISSTEASPDDDGLPRIRPLLDSKPAAVLHGPKGMCALGKHLYFTDNTRLMRTALAPLNEEQGGGKPELVAEGFQKANDLASDGEAVWLSDTAAGQVFRITPDGKRREIPAPAGVNGLAFHDGRLFAVSWTEHELYELDPTGKAPPTAFGLAEHFLNLDGLEVLDDGTFLVSDFVGNKVCAVSADRKSVTTLLKIDTPADLGLDRPNGILYVPQLKHDRVVVLQLVRGEDE